MTVNLHTQKLNEHKAAFLKKEKSKTTQYDTAQSNF